MHVRLNFRMTVLLEYISLARPSVTVLLDYFTSLGKNDKTACLFRAELSLRDFNSVELLCLVFYTFVVLTLQEQDVVPVV